ERRRAGQGLHAGRESRASGGDHERDHGSCRRRRGAPRKRRSQSLRGEDTHMAITEAEATKTAERAEGRVVNVIGPVVDVEFPPEHLPEIDTALEITRETNE